MTDAAAMQPRDFRAFGNTGRLARALFALLDLAKALNSEVDLDSLLAAIVEKASFVVDAERTSVFVFDAGRDVLWTRSAQGLGATVEIPVGSGLAGDVARSRELVNVSDAYADPRFNPDVDRHSGFRTRSILAAPVLDSSGNLLGVLESVNKVNAERFDEDDEALIRAMASHTAVAMERARFTASVLEHERLAESLRLASDIQMRMLPSGIAGGSETTAPFQIHAYIRPARMVGGDLYDFAAAQDRLYFCVGDVSGKGIGAALVMALTKTLFRASLPYYADAAKLMEAVNLILCEETDPTMFVTAFCGFLDLHNGMLQFSNAGHERPFLLHADGKVEMLECQPGLALGVVPAFRYPLQQKGLEPGDALFLYTDGVTEATSGSSELFTVDRVRTVLERCSRESVLRVLAVVTAEVEEFVHQAPQADDITMMCIRYCGSAGAES